MRLPKKHRLNPEKLYLSKWTAVFPRDKERHFLVTEMIRDEALVVTGCRLEAILTRREQRIPWQELQDPQVWQRGWK